MTEKEKALLQRKAYILGTVEDPFDPYRRARELYPMPKELREIKIGQSWYRWNNDRFEYLYLTGSLWRHLTDITPDYWSADELSLLADLKRNPYVEVDDD